MTLGWRTEDIDKKNIIYEAANWILDHEEECHDDASFDALRQRGMADKSLSVLARHLLSQLMPFNWFLLGKALEHILAERETKGER